MAQTERTQIATMTAYGITARDFARALAGWAVAFAAGIALAVALIGVAP